MKKIPLFLVFLLFVVFPNKSFSNGNDSLLAPRLLSENLLTNERSDILQFGFRLGTDLSLTSRQLSDYDHLSSLFSGTFGFFMRAGYRYIYGEFGLNYMFFKGGYESLITDLSPTGAETVESRYLQVPLKVVGQIAVGKKFAFLPNAGFLYQPLIHTTKNDINYGKKNLCRHQFLFTAGLGIRIKFVTIDVAYKQSLKPFFSDRSSIKPSFLNILLGFQF